MKQICKFKLTSSILTIEKVFNKLPIPTSYTNIYKINFKIQMLKIISFYKA